MYQFTNLSTPMSIEPSPFTPLALKKPLHRISTEKGEDYSLGFDALQQGLLRAIEMATLTDAIHECGSLAQPLASSRVALCI